MRHFGREQESPAEPEKLTRRNFLVGSALTVGSVVYGDKLLNDYERDTKPAEVSTAEEILKEPESVEVPPRLQSEHFDRFKTGYQAWWVMPYQSVVFVDENNKPVAPPIAFQEFTISRSRIRDGKEVTEDYLLTPGAMDEYGFLVDNFDPNWLEHIKPLVAKKYGVNASELKPKHITEEFERALVDSRDEVLIAKIHQGEITRVLDILYYYADISASKSDSRNKITYIKEELMFTEPNITPLMAAELRSLVPALCAKESLFKDRKPNDDGAQGIAQFKSDVWSGLGLGEYGERQPFTKQVEAIGLQFGQIYRELVSNERVNEMMAQLETLFVSRESFEKHCLVPLMVNSYNSGAKRMKEVIQTFMAMYSTEKLREWYAPIDGMDLFFAMSQHAVKNGVDGYGSDSSQYIGYIYGLRDVLETEHQEQKQLASNE